MGTAETEQKHRQVDGSEMLSGVGLPREEGKRGTQPELCVRSTGRQGFTHNSLQKEKTNQLITGFTGASRTDSL